MKVLANHQPKDVLGFFEEICSIPHGSRNLEQISNYLVNFAKERNLRYRQDEAKNVIIWKDGSTDAKDAPAVILQGHMDMVAVKDLDCTKNLETEGLDLYEDGDWIRAKGTSLGGDDGIAVAYMLAILNDNTLVHPPIEAVFTTDEEIGLLGATALDVSDLKGKTLINMDSEDEGVFTVSCAGGGSTHCHVPLKREKRSGVILDIALTGLTGGHSGIEIHKGRRNSNVVMGRLINEMLKTTNLWIVDICGGEKDNAIANKTEARILVEEADCTTAVSALKLAFDVIKVENLVTDPDMKLAICDLETQEAEVLTQESTMALNLLLNLMPYGVQRMNPSIEGLVQTSLNMGILKTDDKEAVMTFAVRSSKESEKTELNEKLTLLTEFVGGYVTKEGEYPGWDYRADSRVLDIMVETYRDQYNNEPVVEGIHAGLECGIFASKIEDLDAISFGPQMYNVHTTQERISISSIKRTYILIKSALERLAEL